MVHALVQIYRGTQRPDVIEPVSVRTVIVDAKGHAIRDQVLALTPKELKSLRSPLERCGAVVARSMVYEEPHRHTSVLARWDQVEPEPSGAADPRHALGDLVCAGVRASVVARAQESARWFSWRWYWDDGLVDELVESGRLARVDGHLAVDA